MKVFRATEKDQYIQPVEFDPGIYTFHAVVKGEVYSFALKTESGAWLNFDLSWQLEEGEWSRITHTFDLTEKCVEFSLFASETTSEVLIGDPMFEEGNNRSTPSPHPADGFEQTQVSFDILDDKIVAEITGENGRLTKAEQTLESIETTVYDPDTGESKITQLANEVETKVSKDGVISSINVSTEGIDINAERINFTGSVKFESAVRDEVQDDLNGLAGDIQDAQQAADNAQSAANDAAAEAADALAKANTSKAITDKFATTIDGGLISTVMMILRELDSPHETAGVSGIQGELRNNPAFWAGGTYAQAFALIQFLSKMSAGTTPSTGEYEGLAKITMLHNGAAKVGDFIIEESGRIVMVDPATGAPRLVFGVQNIPSVATLMGTYNPGGGPITIGAGLTGSSQILSGSINVTQAGAAAQFGGVTISISGVGTSSIDGFSSSASATLWAYRNGVKAISLGSAFVHFTAPFGYGEYEEDVRIIPPFAIAGIQSGLYTFRLEVETSGNVQSPSATSTPSTFSWQFAVADVRRQQYGLDGMMFYYTNHHFHFTEGGGMDGRALPDKWNAPGVLLSGTVGTNGTFSNWWGAKKHGSQTAVKNSTGRYTVYHTIGHENYQVTATALTANRSCYIVSKGTSSFVIEWRTIGSSPSLVDTSFDFQITGNNYNT